MFEVYESAAADDPLVVGISSPPSPPTRPSGREDARPHAGGQAVRSSGIHSPAGVAWTQQNDAISKHGMLSR
jgi:hypothetical protein